MNGEFFTLVSNLFFFFEKQQSNRSKVESWNSKKLNDGYTVCKRERVKRISIRD